MENRKQLKGRLIALDSASARHFDDNGYLHVDGNALTCDQVAGYWGYELPQDDAHPVDPDRIYYAYRPAEELQKALDTYNGVPLLIKHEFDSPEEPLKDLRVGAIGTDAAWDAPFVRNSLTIWDQAAIDAVLSGRLSDLSCGYTFEPEWGAGKTADGIEYDFKMKSIKCNHVALVENGRATDCRVADSQPIFNDEVTMEKLASALKAAGIEASEGQLAQILAALKDEPAGDEDEGEQPEAKPEGENPEGDKPEDKTEDEGEGEKPAEDEGEDKPESEDEDCASKDEGEDKPEPKAADAQAVDAEAIAKAVAKRFAAADSVRPFVGKVDPMAFKSEGAIYAHALKAMGFDGIPETSAADVFSAILKERKTHTAADSQPTDTGNEALAAALARIH